MPAQPLSSDQKQDAARLKAIYEKKKKALGFTQESLASACGWESQGTVSQYLNGKIPLNLEAGVKFARALRCSVAEFSPRLAADLPPSTDHAAAPPAAAGPDAQYLARQAPISRNPEVSRALFDLARELERGDLSPEVRHLLTSELDAKARFVREAFARLQKNKDSAKS